MKEKITQLPHWCITDLQPAFYDTDSATVVEQTGKVYRKVKELIDAYNNFVDVINNHIKEFENGTNQSIEVFQTGIRQEFQDFIDIVNLEVQNQDVVIQNAVDYMKTNLYESITQIISEMRESGKFDEVVLNAIDNISSRVLELELFNINVKSFGVIGDGETDDTQAIQNVLNEYNNVVFPAGIYKITSSLTLKSNQSIKGLPGSVIKYYGDGLDSTPILKVKANDNITPIENVYITGINIDCENQIYKGGSSSSSPKLTSPYAYNKGLIGIHVSYGRNIKIENCTINDLFGNGILVHYSSNVDVINNNLYDTGGSNALGDDSFGDGICFFSSINCKAKDNTIINKRTYLTHEVNYKNIDVYGKICGRSGLEFEYRLDQLWGNSTDSKYYCVDYDLVNDMKQYGCIFENNYIYGYSKGIHLEEDVKSIIKNNTIIHNHIGIINTTGCEGTIIDGNYFNSDNVGASPEGNYDANYCAIFLADSNANKRVFGKTATNNKIFGDSNGIHLNGFEAIISNNEFKCLGNPIYRSEQSNMSGNYESEKLIISNNYFDIKEQPLLFPWNSHNIIFEGNVFTGENAIPESGYITGVQFENNARDIDFTNNIFKNVLIDLLCQNGYHFNIRFNGNQFLDSVVKMSRIEGVIYNNNTIRVTTNNDKYDSVFECLDNSLRKVKFINNACKISGLIYKYVLKIIGNVEGIEISNNELSASSDNTEIVLARSSWNVSNYLFVKNNIYKEDTTVVKIGGDGSTIPSLIDVDKNLGIVNVALQEY